MYLGISIYLLPLCLAVLMHSITTSAPFLQLLAWLPHLGAPTYAIDYKSRMDSALDEVFGNNTRARVTLVRHFDARRRHAPNPGSGGTAHSPYIPS